MCAKNAKYAENVAERFRPGESLTDFPKEDYETDWANRFTEDDLNEIGARSLGIQRRSKTAQRESAI